MPGFAGGHQLSQVHSSQILFMGKPSKSLKTERVAFFLQWNRLHPQVMCQSPKAYSDSVPVLNLMLRLSHWTRGHSKVKLKLQMMKKRSAQKKREGSPKTRLSNLTPLAESSGDITSNRERVSGTGNNMRRLNPLMFYIHVFLIEFGYKIEDVWMFMNLMLDS